MTTRQSQIKGAVLGIIGVLAAGVIVYFASTYADLPDRMTRVEVTQARLLRDVAKMGEDTSATRSVVDRMAGRLGVEGSGK